MDSTVRDDATRRVCDPAGKDPVQFLWYGNCLCWRWLHGWLTQSYPQNTCRVLP